MLEILALALVVLFTLAATAIFRSSHPAPRAVVGPTPIDEAERILTRRYARGEITFEQYERMRTILRH